MLQEVQDHAVSARLEAVLIQAAHDAGEQLSAFMERDVRLHGTSAQRVRLEDVPSVLDDRDGLVTAIYLGFTGDLEGHVMLAFAPEIAAQMAAALLMEPVGAPENLGPMETSALGEVGNITAASFLNSVASACQLAVYPTPPLVVQDMAGALLDGVILEMALESTHGLLLHTLFEIDGDRLEGALILLPSATADARLESAVAACQ